MYHNKVVSYYDGKRKEFDMYACMHDSMLHCFHKGNSLSYQSQLLYYVL